MKKKFMYSVLLALMISCSNGSDDIAVQTNSNNNGNNNNPPSSEWLIPRNEVLDGGPGKDGIPSIDDPKFVDVFTQDFINDDDLVIGVNKNGTIKAYPHSILNWHEIVNDKFSQELVTINYCPLTGTAFAWDSMSDGVASTFGVSGLLYNANLILYDRNTDSYWSQLRLECVSGGLIGDEPTMVNLIQTNWLTWKTLYPNTLVLGTDTGFNRAYNVYPYGDYLTFQDFLIFPASPLNNTLPLKERVYSLIDEDKSKVYQYSNFENGKILIDSFNEKQYLIVGNENLLKGFHLTEDHVNLSFEYDFSVAGILFKDNEGNRWTVFGEAISGPRTGQKLSPAKSVVGYWFAIAAFYPNPEIYSD